MTARQFCRLLIFSIVLGAASAAQAVIYNFDHQVWGNSSIALNNAAGRQIFMEVLDATDTAEPNDAFVKISNHIPPEQTDPPGVARVAYIYFDTGVHTDLVTGIEIADHSPDVTMYIPGGRPTMDIRNGFDASFTEDYSVGLGKTYPDNAGHNAINPGEYLTLRVHLGAGYTVDDLLAALDEGRTAATALDGVRVSLIVHRIWGVAADDDHAAFVHADPVALWLRRLEAAPAELYDDQSSQLTAEVEDLAPGPAPLQYHWTILSGGGSLDDPTSATPVYTPADVTGDTPVTLQVTVDDSENSLSDTLDLLIHDAAAPPQITSQGATSATVGRPYHYDADDRVEAVGPGPIQYSLLSGPAGMTVSSDGLVSWTPAAGQEGPQSVQIQASNGNGDDVQSYTIQVSQPPSGGVIDFNATPPSSYAGSQDRTDTGSVQILDGGATLYLEGNRWQKIDFPYTITPDTVLEFDYSSTAEGEVQGIGLVSSDALNKSHTFKVYGTQNWGNASYDDYPGGGVVKHYVIPVGQYYTGDVQYLFFANDHDVSNPTANSTFSNVQVHE